MSTKHVKEIIKELQDQNLRSDLVQDNKIHFPDGNGLIYRVRMPNQLEMLEADRIRNAHQIKLINQENTMTLYQLKKTLKEKMNIDIDGMEKELLKLEDNMQPVYERLAKKQDDDLEGIKKEKDCLQEIKDERAKIIEEIPTRTAPSIDVQSENYCMSYLTSVCTETNTKSEGEIVWEPTWKSFDEYLKAEDSNLKLYAMGWLTTLIMRVKQ